MKYALGKAEKLKSKKWIALLFAEGRAEKAYPLVAVHMPHPDETVQDTQVGFSVSKKRFKKAVTRNLLKRRMREAYRIQKALIPESDTKPLAVMFIYTGKKEASFDLIHKQMRKVLQGMAR